MPTQNQQAYLDNLGFTICLKRAAADPKFIADFDRHYKAKLRAETPMVRLAGDNGRIETPAEQAQAASKAFVEYVHREIWMKYKPEEREMIALEALAQHMGEQTTG